LKHAELVRAEGLKGAFDLFRDEKLDALAGLRPALLENQAEIAGSRVLDGRFTAVRQAIGTKPGNTALAAEIRAFVAEAKANGTVSALIDRFGVTGKLALASDDG
jgi:polar amino acid transport system substrate-binding protein